MHDVQHFRANFDPPAKEGLAADSQIEISTGDVEVYNADSHVRNVCFVWEDGRKAFFNYAYLVSADLVLIGNVNVMLLYFSGQIVKLKGYHLGLLFDLLISHTPKTITASNPRYHVEGQSSAAVVIEIIVRSD